VVDMKGERNEGVLRAKSQEGRNPVAQSSPVHDTFLHVLCRIFRIWLSLVGTTAACFLSRDLHRRGKWG